MPCVRGAARPRLPALRSAPRAAAEIKPLPGSQPREAPRVAQRRLLKLFRWISSRRGRGSCGQPPPHIPRGAGAPRGAQPAPGALGGSAELPVHILPPKSANPSRSERCLGFQTPRPRSPPGWKGPWGGGAPAGTRVSPRRSAERPRRSLPRAWEAAAGRE